jgi:pilus assembly protein Flp/PilA
MSRILTFLKSEDGPTAVEYAVMLALIIAVCIAAIGAVGSNTRAMFNDNNTKLNSAW